MKVIKTEESYIYKGKLQIDQDYLVEFAVSVSCHDEYPVGQIIFNRLALLPPNADRLVWLECLNKLNISMSLYYYFVLDEAGYIFARYVANINEDMKEFFDILSNGGQIMRNALSIFRQLEQV